MTHQSFLKSHYPYTPCLNTVPLDPTSHNPPPGYSPSHYSDWPHACHVFLKPALSSQTDSLHDPHCQNLVSQLPQRPSCVICDTAALYCSAHDSQLGKHSVLLVSARLMSGKMDCMKSFALHLNPDIVLLTKVRMTDTTGTGHFPVAMYQTSFWSRCGRLGGVCLAHVKRSTWIQDIWLRTLWLP